MDFLEDAKSITNPKFKVTKRKEGKVQKNIKSKAVELNGEVQTILQNLLLLIESIALLNVSVFAFLTYRGNLNPTQLNKAYGYFVAFSIAVIGLRGAYEFLRYLRK